jgi:hypothetical protein
MPAETPAITSKNKRKGKEKEAKEYIPLLEGLTSIALLQFPTLLPTYYGWIWLQRRQRSMAFNWSKVLLLKET